MVTAVGWYPVVEDAQGWVAIVWVTVPVFVSITETVSLFVFTTYSVVPSRCIAVGCSCTAIEVTGAAGFAVSMTLTVPVVEVPSVGVRGDLRAVRAHRRVAGDGLAAALVGDVELAADERQLARRDADREGLLDRAGDGVDGRHGVLAVDRRVQRRAVGREGHARGQGLQAARPSGC